MPSSLHAASAFMAAQIDPRVAAQAARVGRGIELHTWAYALNDTAFCNVHEVTWHPGAAKARLHIRSCPVNAPADGHAAGALVTASAGFFFLADRCSALPRQASLNLAISGGRIVSLRVTDREAVLCRRGTLSAGYVRAQGLLVLDGTRLTWAGSRTGRAADCYVYGNANAVIRHHDDPVTGAARMLDEASRLTPPMSPGGTMTDIGFMSVDDGGFRAVTASGTGQVDIFRHDLVLRCPARFAGPGRSSSRVDILQIDWLGCADLPDSAVSAGMYLDCPNFTAHPVNHDRSLGSRPPFTARRMARMVLYADPQNRMHLRLFDGRPQSPPGGHAVRGTRHRRRYRLPVGMLPRSRPDRQNLGQRRRRRDRSRQPPLPALAGQSRRHLRLDSGPGTPGIQLHHRAAVTRSTRHAATCCSMTPGPARRTAPASTRTQPPCPARNALSAARTTWH